MRIVEKYAENNCDKIVLADTLGTGYVSQMKSLVDKANKMGIFPFHSLGYFFQKKYQPHKRLLNILYHRCDTAYDGASYA